MTATIERMIRVMDCPRLPRAVGYEAMSVIQIANYIRRQYRAGRK